MEKRRTTRSTSPVARRLTDVDRASELLSNPVTLNLLLFDLVGQLAQTNAALRRPLQLIGIVQDMLVEATAQAGQALASFVTWVGAAALLLWFDVSDYDPTPGDWPTWSVAAIAAGLWWVSRRRPQVLARQ